MQAIILAGGLGTRLRSVVAHVPKPMAQLTHEPFLAVLLRYAYAQGVREVVLCLHHQAHIIRDYFGDCFEGLTLHYAIEETPLGTGGAIRQALPLLDQSKPVLVMNGDSLVMLNYREALNRHQTLQAPMTIASVEMPVTDRYSKLTIENDVITHYAVTGDQDAGAISVGFYVMQPDIFSAYALPAAFSLERDFLASHVSQLRPAYFSRVEYFIDIGVPDDYARAQAEVPVQLEKHIAA